MIIKKVITFLLLVALALMYKYNVHPGIVIATWTATGLVALIGLYSMEAQINKLTLGEVLKKDMRRRFTPLVFVGVMAISPIIGLVFIVSSPDDNLYTS